VVQSGVGKSLRLVMTQWIRHLATSLLKSSSEKNLLLESFSEAIMSFGVLLHSRFGSRAASI
jgi:hypothetical protein